MKRLIFFIFINFIILIPIFSEKINDDVFINNRLTEETDVIVLNPVFVNTIKYTEEQELITGELDTDYFMEYKGGFFPMQGDPEKMIFLIRSRFYLDKVFHDREISLYLGMSTYAAEIFINGKKVNISGTHKNRQYDNPFSVTNFYLSEDLLLYDKKVNDLAIKLFFVVSNSAFEQIKIGNYLKLSEEVFFRNFIGINLIQASMVIAFVIFLFFIFLFFLTNLREIKFLYFALVCFFYVLAYLNMAFYYDGTARVLLEKISRAAFPLIIMNLVFFILEFTGILNRNRIIKVGLLIPALTFVLFTFLQQTVSQITGILLYDMVLYIFPLLVIITVILFISILKHKKKKSIVVLIGIIIVIVTALIDSYYVINSLIPYIYILQFGFMAIVISIFYLLAIEQSQLYKEAERRLSITEVYTRHSLVEIIKKGGDPTKYQPEEKELAVMFTDIRDFTNLAENLSPNETVSLLNMYFNRMNINIINNIGEIDKLIGDCIMAFFDKPDDAVNASVEMRNDLMKLNSLLEKTPGHKEKFKRINNGIGINYGPVVIGNIGSDNKMDYTLIGDIVNTASRFEELTKYYKVDIIISEELKDRIGESHFLRPLDLVLVKGRTSPVKIYEVFDHEPENIKKLKLEIQNKLDEAFELYKNGNFQVAERIYSILIKKVGPHRYYKKICCDRVLNFYQKRCRQLFRKQQAGLLKDWEGVYRFIY